MRWITAWLGALKGAAVVVETRQPWVATRTGQVAGNTWVPTAVVALSLSTVSGVVPKLPNQWSEALEGIRQSS